MATNANRQPRSLDTTAAGSRSARGRAANLDNTTPRSQQAPVRAESFGWVNVVQPFVNDDGEEDSISLPFGLDVWNMSKARGNGPIAQGKNALLQMVLDKLDTMEPGERITLPLSVELYKPGEKEGDNDNAMMRALKQLAF